MSSSAKSKSKNPKADLCTEEMLILLVRGSKQANVFIAEQNLKKKIVTLASGKQCRFSWPNAWIPSKHLLKFELCVFTSLAL
jgi:hypothetical protein